VVKHPEFRKGKEGGNRGSWGRGRSTSFTGKRSCEVLGIQCKRGSAGKHSSGRKVVAGKFGQGRRIGTRGISL